MNFEEKLIERLKRVEREVERLRVWERPAGGSGVTDHGALTGLADDDHPQYVKHSLATAASDFLVASGPGAFVKKTLAEVKTILGLGSAAYTNSTAYLGATAKAADSDKLDGVDSTGYATASHNHDHGTLTGLGDNDHPQYVLASAIGIWQDWTPTQTGWTALPTGTYRYCLIGKICFITIDQSAGTSNGTAARLTLPFSVKSGAFYGGSNGLCINNGTLLTVATKYYISSATHTIEFSTDMASAVFVSSGTKRIRVEAFYEIA